MQAVHAPAWRCCLVIVPAAARVDAGAGRPALFVPRHVGAVDADAHRARWPARVQLVFGWTKSFPVSIGRPEPADRRARRRDARADPARRSCSARAGTRPGAAPAVLISTRRVRALVDRALPALAACPAQHAGASHRGGGAVKVARRLRDLAARRRRPGEPRARGRALPARPRTRGRGRRRPPTAAPAPSRIRCAGSSRRLPRRRAALRGAALVARRARARRRRLHDRDVRPQRRGRDARAAARTSSSSPPILRSSERGAAASSRGDVDDFQRGGGGPPARAAAARARPRAAAAPRTSSARARTCASSRSAGASRRAGRACCRTPRRPSRRLGARRAAPPARPRRRRRSRSPGG